MPSTTLAPRAWRQDDDEVVLLATHCGRCDKQTFPPVPVCPRCWERNNLRDVPLPRRGTIQAFSIAHIGAEGIGLPYAIAYIDFPNGLRVCARLREWDRIQVGDHVEPVAGVLRDGPAGALHGWLFQPIDADREQR